MPASRWAAIIGLALAGLAQAQDFPSRPIRLIISSSPGSGVDTIARAVAQRMSEALGVQIIPDNRAGGGGTIGVQAVAKAPGDGYTLLMARSIVHRQRDAGQTTALRVSARFRSHRTGDHGTVHRRRASFAAREEREGADRTRKGAARPAQFRFRRHRQFDASHRRILQAPHADQYRARPLQGLRTRGRRSPRRAHPAHVREPRCGAPQREVGEAARARDDRCGAAASAARNTDRGRSRSARLRHDLVVRPSCAARARRRKRSRS